MNKISLILLFGAVVFLKYEHVSSQSSKSFSINIIRSDDNEYSFELENEAWEEKKFVKVMQRVTDVLESYQTNNYLILLSKREKGYVIHRIETTKGELMNEIISPQMPLVSPKTDKLSYIRWIQRSCPETYDHVLMVFDFKTGESIPVFPEDNFISGEELIPNFTGSFFIGIQSHVWSTNGNGIALVFSESPRDSRSPGWGPAYAMYIDLSKGLRRVSHFRLNLDPNLCLLESKSDFENPWINVEKLSWNLDGSLRLHFWKQYWSKDYIDIFLKNVIPCSPSKLNEPSQ